MDQQFMQLENRLKIHKKLISRDNAQLLVELHTNHIIHRNFQEIMNYFPEFFAHPSIYTENPKNIKFTELIKLIETKMFLPQYYYSSYAAGIKCNICGFNNGNWYISNEKPVNYKNVCSECLPKKNPIQIIKLQNYDSKELYAVLRSLLSKFDYSTHDILENFPNQYFEFYALDLNENLFLFEENKIILELTKLKGYEIIEAYRKTTLPKFEMRMELVKTGITKKNLPVNFPNYTSRFYLYIIKQEEMIEWCYNNPSAKMPYDIIINFCREF